MGEFVCKAAVDKVFRLLTDKVERLQSSLFETTFDGTTLKVFSKGNPEGAFFEVIASDVDCFLKTIPEILTTFLVAQLLKIAQAENTHTCDILINTAGVNMKAKMRMLKSLTARLAPRPALAE